MIDLTVMLEVLLTKACVEGRGCEAVKLQQQKLYIGRPKLALDGNKVKIRSGKSTSW